jgi:hypothetical protein
MKQLLSLFLFLSPCLAWAQYPSNGNQKITLGEQTTADNLIYRGVAATDTVRKPSIDTMAYMVLDTTTNIMWHYKKATSNAWLRVGGSITSGLTGVLPVANGGTNTSTLTANKLMVGNGTSGVLTPTSLHYSVADSSLGIGTNSPVNLLHFNAPDGLSYLRWTSTAATTGARIGLNGLTLFIDHQQNSDIIFRTNSTERMRIKTGDVNIKNLAGTGSRAVLADLDGNLSAPVSSINTKENVQTINYGLNELLQINPVSFNYINKNKWGDGRNLGFIVEDMFPVIPEVTGTMDNGDMYLDMTKLIPILTKAIQEQQALIKALEKRIINLENK